MPKNIHHSLQRIFISIGICLFVSCGGGTSGTGGVTVDGRVFRPNGSAAADVQVVVVDSGDSVRSDANGTFQFTDQPKQDLTLLFESDKAQAQTRIQGITKDVNRISVDCTFDEDRSEARTDRVDVKERDDDDKDDGDRPDKGDSADDDDEDSDKDDDSSGSSGSDDDDNDDDNGKDDDDDSKGTGDGTDDDDDDDDDDDKNDN